MELADYSTEELRAELRRRRKKPTGKPIPKWIEWEGKVTGVHEWGDFRNYSYTIETFDPRVPGDMRVGKFKMRRGRFKKSERPGVGDTVLLEIRYTKDMEKGKTEIPWLHGKIVGKKT